MKKVLLSLLSQLRPFCPLTVLLPAFCLSSMGILPNHLSHLYRQHLFARIMVFGSSLAGGDPMPDQDVGEGF